MVTGKNISLPWWLFTAILSIDIYMTSKRKNDHSIGISLLNVVTNLVFYYILGVLC